MKAIYLCTIYLQRLENAFQFKISLIIFKLFVRILLFYYILYNIFLQLYLKRKITFFEMLYQKQTTTIPKKTSEKLSKFVYYVDTFFPDLFNMNKKTLDSENKVERPMNQLLSKEGNRNIVYNYFYSQCQNSAVIDAGSILNSVKKLYLNQDVIKINDMSYSRQSIFKQSYLPIYGFFSQIIDFVLIVDKQQKINVESDKNKKSGNSKSFIKSDQLNTNQASEHNKNLKTLSKPKQYQLYVIHNCNSFKPESEDIKKISWEHFIERYHFTDKNLVDPQSVSNIKYQLVYACKPQNSLFSFQQKLTRLFIESHSKMTKENTLQNLQKLQGYLLQQSAQVEANKKKENDIAYSDQHRRELKIPIQHFKHYISLKKEIYKHYKQLHNLESQSDINIYFYQNLICRYLIAKQYHFQEAKKLIIEYLHWQKQLKQKYPSINCFQQIHQIGAYRYVGEDFMGRPVILNKAALVDVTTMKTPQQIEKYCDYYIYFIQIYLRTKMRGYIDQMVVLADLSNLSSNNFKLAITKRNLHDSLKYGPQRQLSLVAANVSTFAYTVWSFIKPMLPKKTLSKIQLVGNNKKDIVNSLIPRMDISIIPQYLGGKNSYIPSDLISDQNKQEEKQFLKNSKSLSAASRLSQISQGSNLQQLSQIEIVSTHSQNLQTKKPHNAILNLFQSVSRTFGVNLGN